MYTTYASAWVLEWQVARRVAASPGPYVGHTLREQAPRR